MLLNNVRFDFCEALKYMKQGKKVTRASAKRSREYMRIEGNKMLCCDGSIGGLEREMDGIFTEGLLATDWMLFNE